MTRLRYFAFVIVPLFLSNAATAAITLTPLPGSTPQVAHPLSQYPAAIGVIATDDSAAPVQGLPITFELPAGFLVANQPGGITVPTNAQGVATIPFPGLTAPSTIGTFNWPATAPGATSASFSLASVGTLPSVISVILGIAQDVAPGAVLSQPFVALVSDAAGAPIPYPLVTFVAPSPDGPSGTFNGATSAFAVGDANGIATAPPFTANTVLGMNQVSGLGQTTALNISTFFFFTIKNPGPPPTLTLTPLPGSTPQTAHPNAQFGAPIGVVATNQAGAPVPGLPVTFERSNPPIWVTVSTDAHGIATIPAPGPVALSVYGTYTWPAVAPNAAPVNFTFTVAGTLPAIISVVSGSNQVAAAGAILAHPFVVLVTDANGAPIPFMAVTFQGPSDLGTFNGSSEVQVVADANGIATSPPVTASTRLGTERILAIANSVGSVPFDLTIVQPPPPPVTLTPITGATPQTTRLYCYFPNRVGVVARNLDGTPAAGVTVTFTDFDGVTQVPGEDGTFDVVTGTDGIAYASSPASPAGYVTFALGTTQVVASSARAATPALFNLTVAGKPPTRLELLSGDDQVAKVGGEYAPWVVRAFDEDSLPVPYAATVLLLGENQTDPNVTFADGTTTIELPANTQGIVESPAVVANGFAGVGLSSVFLLADPLDDYNPVVYMHFTNVTGDPGFGSLRVWEAPPASIAVGSTTAIPYSVKVLDAAGHGVAGAPVTFSTDHSCASFAGARTVGATTNASGVATSPPLTGTNAKVACVTSAITAGHVRDLTTHVFDATKVTATWSPRLVQAHVGAFFGIDLAFTEHGQPVHVTQLSVRSLNISSATYATAPVVDLNAGTMTIDLLPNQHTGAYVVEITHGSQRILVPVVQSP